jgi:hypothetical protein
MSGVARSTSRARYGGGLWEKLDRHNAARLFELAAGVCSKQRSHCVRVSARRSAEKRTHSMSVPAEQHEQPECLDESVPVRIDGPAAAALHDVTTDRDKQQEEAFTQWYNSTFANTPPERIVVLCPRPCVEWMRTA